MTINGQISESLALRTEPDLRKRLMERGRLVANFLTFPFSKCARENAPPRAPAMVIVSLASSNELAEGSKKWISKERYLQHLQQEWDSLLWIFAALFVLYYFEFVFNIFFNKEVNRFGSLFVEWRLR